MPAPARRVARDVSERLLRRTRGTHRQLKAAFAHGNASPEPFYPPESKRQPGLARMLWRARHQSCGLDRDL